MSVKLETWLDNDTYSMLMELVNSAEDARTSEVLKGIIFKEYLFCKGSELPFNNIEARVTYIEEFDIARLNSKFEALLDKVLDLDRRIREFTLSERIF